MVLGVCEKEGWRGGDGMGSLHPFIHLHPIYLSTHTPALIITYLVAHKLGQPLRLRREEARVRVDVEGLRHRLSAAQVGALPLEPRAARDGAPRGQARHAVEVAGEDQLVAVVVGCFRLLLGVLGRGVWGGGGGAGRPTNPTAPKTRE